MLTRQPLQQTATVRYGRIPDHPGDHGDLPVLGHCGRLRLTEETVGVACWEIRFHNFRAIRTYISAVERCIWNVALGNIEKIAGALDVEPWQLLVPPK